jgi:carboxymethylenebutenolidase
MPPDSCHAQPASTRPDCRSQGSKRGGRFEPLPTSTRIGANNAASAFSESVAKPLSSSPASRTASTPRCACVSPGVRTFLLALASAPRQERECDLASRAPRLAAILHAMQSSTVSVRTADGVADAYLTRPDDRAHRAVLFMVDAIGLRPRIEEMADRIATRGYVVLAPNVFYRAGRAPVLPLPDFTDADSRASFMQAVRPLMEQLAPERIVQDGACYLDYLAAATPSRVAICGYCMGARLGWRIASAYPDRVVALGCFHGGGLLTDAPDSPHRSAGQLKAELYLGHADQDANMTAEQIALLERALEEAGVRFRSELYTGAMHGYTMSDTAVYNEAACERHFSELFALLDRAFAAQAIPGAR